jgi:hypothetical protein
MKLGSMPLLSDHTAVGDMAVKAAGCQNPPPRGSMTLGPLIDFAAFDHAAHAATGPRRNGQKALPGWDLVADFVGADTEPTQTLERQPDAQVANLLQWTVRDRRSLRRRVMLRRRIDRRDKPMKTLYDLLKGLPLLIATALCSFPSSAFDLNGIWATDAQLCSKMFERRGSDIAFTPLSDLYGSGFVIDGTHIKGKMAQCTIQSQKQDGEILQIEAACATEIMRSDMQFSLKIINDKTISRRFLGMSGIEVNYYRCPL